MKELILQTRLEVYDAAELSAEDKQLLAAAKRAAQDAYAPYSNFKVGASLLLANGQIVLGSNQENAAYPSGLCAERTALFAAGAQFPGIKILKLFVTIISQQQNIARPVPPCGSCRQVVYEYENRYEQDIAIYLQGDSGDVYRVSSIKDLLPLLFDASYLNVSEA